VAEPFQNLDHADPRAREQRVHKTRNEKRDGHAWPVDGKFKAIFSARRGAVSSKKSFQKFFAFSDKRGLGSI
jgi:hypothetical protein